MFGDAENVIRPVLDSALNPGASAYELAPAASTKTARTPRWTGRIAALPLGGSARRVLEALRGAQVGARAGHGPVALVVDGYALLMDNENTAPARREATFRRVVREYAQWPAQLLHGNAGLDAGSKLIFVTGSAFHGIVSASLPLTHAVRRSRWAAHILAGAGWEILDALQMSWSRPDFNHHVEQYNHEKQLPMGGVPFMFTTVLLNMLCSNSSHS